MKTKMFEIRDRMTFIPVLAIKIDAQIMAHEYLLRKSGYNLRVVHEGGYIMLVGINGGGGKASTSEYGWNDGSRTMMVAHKHINRHFDSMDSGEVVDVEYILGETDTKKPPQASSQDQTFDSDTYLGLIWK